MATLLSNGSDIPIISSAPASNIPASGFLSSKFGNCSCHGSQHAMATTIPKQGLWRGEDPKCLIPEKREDI